MDRRLAAILAADVVGYSRLMERDEAETYRRMRTHRMDLFEPEIAAHHGRVFKLMGDGLLAEFGSVVDAVECAFAIQRGMAERNSGLPSEQRMDLRIGITLGDVIVDGDDRHGEGVNIAARLQQLAKPGGIAISRTVLDHVKHKLSLDVEKLGARHLKNITEPVDVYLLAPETTADGVRAPPLPLPRGRRRAWAAVAAFVLLFGLGGAAAYWHLNPGEAQPVHRLSIVVLPLSNLGNDREDEYFAEGITNDLTADLSRIAGSFVIAPSSARTYKGVELDPKRIGRELGVRYILDGSLRRTEDRVRINAQLIDTGTGAAIWSDRFDGDWTRSTQLQDIITGRLARRLDLELTNEESRRGEAERPNSPDAVDLSMRAWSVLNQPYSREQLAQARALFERALNIDPDLPKALVGLSQVMAIEVNYRWSDTPTEQLQRANDTVTRVLSAFPDDAMAHFVKGEILRAGGRNYEAAIGEYDSAIAINPSLAPAYGALGGAMIRAGRSREAFTPLEMAISLSPRDPLLNIWLFYICHAHSHLGEDELAIEWCRRSVAVKPFWIAYADLAADYARTGRESEARTAVSALRKLMPDYTVTRWSEDCDGWSDNPVFLAEFRRITEGLRQAGLPER
jgi:class 3 adenylate cyclase/TolB-like protein/tetratricopeptide (TPR) repeat protein